LFATLLILVVVSLFVGGIHVATDGLVPDRYHFLESAMSTFIGGLGVSLYVQARFRGDSERQQELMDQLEEAKIMLEEQALTDPLTGISNRRGFQRAFEQELARFQRHDAAFCLAILDVNGLKKLNDSKGHAEGDRVLKATANMLTETARKCDIVARIGGDEFAVLLPETDREGAQGYLERLRTVMEARLQGSSRFEISVGVASSEDGIEDIFERADMAMYLAKPRRRSRAVVQPAPQMELEERKAS